MVPNGTGTQNGSWSSGIDGGGSGGGGTEAGLKKGPWTAAEDSILTEYVRKHGEGNWNAVQKNSGLNRCGKSCRLRWANHLRPSLKKGVFSPDEERTILELHAKFGNKWARMAAQLPGRTDNEIKNYWNTRVKRRQRQGLPLYPHDIKPLSAPTTPTPTGSAPTIPTPTGSAPTTPTPTTSSAPPHFHFPAAQSVAHIQSLSPFSSPNPLPFSPSSSLSHSIPFHCTPPILGIPARFDRFNRFNGQFPLPLTPDLQQNSNAFLIQSPRSQLTELAYFRFPTHLTANPMENLQTQYESQHMAMSLVNSELPSNQIIMESEAVPPVNHRRLLDDLFADPQAFDASKGTHCLVINDDKRFFDGFNKMDDSIPAHFYLGEAQKEEVREAVSLGQYDWSKLLNGIPPAPPEGKWYDTRGEISNVHSSNLAGDEGGIDLQNLTSLYQVPSESHIGRTPTCAWDNLPRIP